MDYIFDNNLPIYIQIADIIRIEIVSKKLLPGEKIPSVRELALRMKANPNTVQKALSSLEDENLIYTERTNGKFVTENAQLIEKVKYNLAKEKVKTYLEGMESLGIDSNDAVEYLLNLKE